MLRVRNHHYRVLPPREPRLRKRSLKEDQINRPLAPRNPNRTIVIKESFDAEVLKSLNRETVNSEKMQDQDQDQDPKDLEDSRRGRKVAKSLASKQDLKLAQIKLLVNKFKTIKFETTFINNCLFFLQHSWLRNYLSCVYQSTPGPAYFCVKLFVWSPKSNSEI